MTTREELIKRIFESTEDGELSFGIFKDSKDNVDVHLAGDFQGLTSVIGDYVLSNINCGEKDRENVALSILFGVTLAIVRDPDVLDAHNDILKFIEKCDSEKDEYADMIKDFTSKDVN